MKTFRTILVAVFTIALLPLHVAPAQVIPQEALTFAQNWLLGNCDTGDGQAVARELTKWAPLLEPIFLHALEQGPDSKLLSEVERAAGERYKTRFQLIESGETFGLSEENLKRAGSISQQQFIENAKHDFVVRYKSQALIALGIIGTDRAKVELERLANDKESPLQSSAVQALNVLRKRTGR